MRGGGPARRLSDRLRRITDSPSEAVRLRRSRPDDLPRLLDIWRSSVAATHDFLSAEDFAALDRLVSEDYLPAAALEVAVDGDDRPLAFLGQDGDAIDALFVHPDRHRQGLGRRLVEAARARGGPLRVDVNEQNPGGRAFYERLGFRLVGRSPLDGQGRPYPLLHLSEA